VVSLAFISGPWLIDFFTHQEQTIQHVYLFLSLAYALCFIALLCFFQETVSRETLQSYQRRFSTPFKELGSFFKKGALRNALIIWIIFYVGFAVFFQYSGRFLFNAGHFPNETINHFFSLLAFIALLIQIFFIQPFAKKLTHPRYISLAIFCVAIGLCGMGFSFFSLHFYIFLIIYTMGIALWLASMNAYISNLAGADKQGSLLSFLLSLQAGTILFASFLGMTSLSSLNPFWIGGAVIAVAGFLSLLKFPSRGGVAAEGRRGG
jgi:hypothetical protein